jgi:hypothetical protein
MQRNLYGSVISIIPPVLSMHPSERDLFCRDEDPHTNLNMKEMRGLL